MRNLLFAIPFLAIAACSASSRVAYVNTDQAIAQTEDWKAAAAETKAWADARKPEYETATAALKKAIDAKAGEGVVKAAQDAANEIANRINGEIKRRDAAAAQKVLAGINRILPRLAAAKNVAAIPLIQSAAYIDPKLDVTADLVQRYNAGEGDGVADAEQKAKTAEAKAKTLESRIDALEAEKAKTAPVAVNAQARKAASP